MANKRLRRKLFEVEATDEGVVLIPFAFTINGTTTPKTLLGDELLTLTRTSAGRFLMTLRDASMARIFYADVSCSPTAGSTDLYGRADWSSTQSAGTVNLLFLTGSTETDPATTTLVGGFLLVKKTSRRARARAQS